MACPICQSKRFYLKDPEDDYEIFEFKCEKGRIQFNDEEDATQAPKLSEDPEIYCQRCAWHGKIAGVE